MVALLQASWLYADGGRRKDASTRTFGERHFEISLDSLEGLGVFTELETIAQEGDFEESREAVKTLAERLGLEGPLVKSYLAMKMEAESNETVDEK